MFRDVIGLPFRMRATAGVYRINGNNYKSLDEAEESGEAVYVGDLYEYRMRKNVAHEKR